MTIPRAAIYARCSAQRQADKELSIPAQLDACRAEARRRGWEVVAEYVDEAESARTADRPQFQEMIAAAKRRPPHFRHILVWKFSRFSRSREDSVLYKAMLQKNGVRLVSLNEPLEDTPTGRMMEGMLEVLDEFYSANLAEDTVRGMRKNAELGYHNGGRTPTGYVSERQGTEAAPKRRLVPCPTFGPIVQRIYRMCLAGEGAATIARTLNDEGLRTRRNKLWSKNTVLSILRNEVYVGVLVWGKKRTGRQAVKEARPIRIEDAHDPLVSREEWQQAQARIQQRTRRRIHPRRLSSRYLLSGLLYCGHCGSSFIGHPAKSSRVHYYGCQQKMKSGATACDAKLLNQVAVEEAVIDELKRAVLTPDHLRELVDLVNAELSANSRLAAEEIAAVTGQIDEARKKLDRLFEVLEQGHLEMAVLAPRIREWKGRVDDLVARKQELDGQVGGTVVRLVSEHTIRGYVEGLHRLLGEGSLNARKAFLRSWIQRIDAYGRDLTVTYTLPPMPPEPGAAAALPMAVGAEGLSEADPATGPGSTKAEPGTCRVLPMAMNGSPPGPARGYRMWKYGGHRRPGGAQSQCRSVTLAAVAGTVAARAHLRQRSVPVERRHGTRLLVRVRTRVLFAHRHPGGSPRGTARQSPSPGLRPSIRRRVLLAAEPEIPSGSEEGP